ncbi:hypothetical protein LPAF129_15800 [Ligilactobacillus pabuli]|uniref:Uncharacterized protein n=1 Tax=Ligilactobacillus pabuli TaxID=2886039 RepID=A0ABQ5JIF2_9LACO|nr:hypothetical protein [Ligilactobacillus pabuli]GKS81894.1 hypothetical protein LPAF129_15800 [Ligilactobacillus pabuli]
MQIKGSIRSYQAKLRQIVKENDFLAWDYSRERVYTKAGKKAVLKPKIRSQSHVEAMLKYGD